ncbi:hypothetical protein LguiA_019045 [Lonicera macranthoides]
MAEKPVLQKPPGYKDPAQPVQRPPPRKPKLPPSFYEKKSRRSCCRTCCCLFCLLIILGLLFFVTAGGVFYVWFEPRVPVLHLKNVQIPRFNITAGNDVTALDAQTVISVEIKNPNSHLSMIYDRTHVYLNSEDHLDLGSSSLPGFTQGKKNTTTLKLTTMVTNELIDSGVGKKLHDGFKSKSLPLTVEIRTAVGLKGGGWSTTTVGVRAICGATLKQIGSGDMPTCTIKLLEL